MIPKTEKEKAYLRVWYKKNRKAKIAYTKKYQKDNNYASEKTPLQREIRSIKRKTRKSFPLENQKCDFCNLKATEHHHFTIPLEYDKFNFVCHSCHIEKDLELDVRSKLISNRTNPDIKTKDQQRENKE